MKTKISHLGRSTVSVILAVMMLLSTMLIGTVSTVNAATGTVTVYFKNTVKWSEVYAYFYRSSYWDGSNGSGSSGIAGGPFKMTKVEGTDDIYSYTYTGDYSQYISFTKDKQENFGNFWSTEAVYRTDFEASKALYTPNTTSSGSYNSVNYYNNGTWTAYSGGSGGGSTEATYYLGGRVGQNLESDTWLGFTKDYVFQKTETSGLYKYVSNQTPAQWTQIIGNDLKQYFFVHTGSNAKWYGSTEETGLTSANQVATLSEYSGDDTGTARLLYINNSDISGDVTFWFDTRNSDKQLYYTVGSESSQTPVAESVSLTASPETVTSGGSTTLTATLTDKATGVDKVTYTFKKDDGTVVGTVTDSAENTASFNVDNITSDTTYTVTVSADNYKSITSNEATVTVEAKKTFYLFNSEINDIAQWPDNNGIEMKLVDGKYVAQLDLEYSDTGANHYFAINDSSNKPTKDSQLWHGKTEYSITNNVKNVNGAGPQEYNQVYYFYFAYYKLNSVTIEFDGVNKVTITDGGSTAETVKITVPTVDNAKVTAVANNSTIYNEGQSFDIKEGSPFTVNVTGENDYTLKKITYGTKTGTETGAEFTAKSGVNTFNVDMVQTVSNPFTVTFGPNNSDYGTVSATKGTTPLESPATVNVRDEVTIKATPSGSNYIFESWTINGDYVIKDSKTISDAEITLVVYGDITATASFKETSPYQVAYGSNGTLMRMNKTKYDGVYISTGTIVSSPGNDKNPASHFTIYDTAKNQFAFISASGNYYWLKDDNLSITMGEGDYWKDAYDHGEKKGLINNACKSAKYVVYNANTKTITLTGDPDYGTKATLYVKNGTYSTSFKTGATKDYAGLSVAAGLATTKTDPCNTYSVDLDTNVNIQTTLAEAYRKAGYYVAAYSVNGRNYPASAKNADQGIYQANITITEDLAENCVVEVTPIYYNRTIEKDDNYITFYVDAERLVGGWGSTVAIYAYAYEGGTAKYDDKKNVTNNVNLLGAYPGQPMVKDGQYYVAKIPRYSYKISSDGSLKIDPTSPVAGITLNNYYNDAVHNSLVPIKRNMQTYDFSDFVELAKKKDVKTIMFQSKFYNADDKKANRNTSVVFHTEGEITNLNPEKSIPNIGEAATIKVNPYEDFTDYYGRATDAIGNLLNDAQKADTDNLYIISTGSYDNQSSDYSTKGQWVTIWNVYDHNGNLITYGTPADFLKENTKQYKEIAEKYKGKPVKISYEKGLLYDGVRSRTDGRWYYSTLGQQFTSDVAIEYKENQNDKVYTADTDSNVGNNTGFVGTTTKATATINNVTTASFSSVTETAHLNIKVANGWRFDGWYINDDKIGDNYTDISTDILMSNIYHIVARVSKIPTGTLELNHTAYTGPESHSGTGFYYISAVLKKEGGSEIKFDETQGVISIDKFAENDELTITLRAKCHGDNTVYALYEGEAGGYTEIGTGLNGKSEFTHTVTVPAGSLFENGELRVNALNYYTDIVKVGGTCDITYMYKDRFGVEGEGKMVSYVVRNVELSTEEILKDYLPSDETITKYAPRIDTMYLETKWNLTDIGKVKKGRSQATVIATQTPKTCDVYYPNKDGEYYTDIKNKKTVDYNTLFKDDNGNFILSAPETDKNGKQFSYWDVYKADKTGDNTGELVTKCYERNFGLRIMADYYIEPVYGVTAPTLTANINAPVLNREIYGDSANPKDKLYVDLLTAFTSSDIPTFKENTTPLKVECGVFVVRNNTSTLSVDHRNTLVQEALDKNKVDTTSAILESYKRTPNTEELVVNKLEALAVDPNVKDKSNTFDTFDNEQYRITKFIFDNDTLTNKNRIDEVLKYTNNTANQNYIFTAYAFVVIKNSDGTVKEKKISDPQYFNLCYVGNKALDNN